MTKLEVIDNFISPFSRALKLLSGGARGLGGKMKLNYHNRKFTGVTNSPNGQVSGDTIFHYLQHGNILTASYSGGSIQQGYILGIVNEDNSLDFVYHHLDEHHLLKSGHCHSVPELLEDGRIRLHEKWSWTYPTQGEGNSIVDEISP